MQYRMTKADEGAAQVAQSVRSPRRLRVGAGWLVLILGSASLVCAGAPLAASADSGGGPLCVVPSQTLAMGDSEDHDDDETATGERAEGERATDEVDDESGQPGPETLFMPSPPEQFNETAQARLNAIENTLEAAERANRQHAQRAGDEAPDDDDEPIIGADDEDEGEYDAEEIRERTAELETLRERFATVRSALDQADEQQPETLAVYQAAVDAQLTQLEEDLGRFRGSVPEGEEPEMIDEPTPPEY